MTEQKYTSANTCIHSKLPEIYNLRKNQLKGKSIIDIGCGKYDNAKKWAEENNATVAMYDKYNRTEQENAVALSRSDYDVSILSNVLNVIYEPEIRCGLVKLAVDKAPLVYVTVYQKDGKGNGRETKPDCWQEDRKIDSYVEEIQGYVPEMEVTRKGKVIEINRKEKQTVDGSKEKM